MSYAQGSIIEAWDYNNLAWKANTATYNNGDCLAQVVGTGFGYLGYGQSTTPISPVSIGGTVTGTQFAGLVYLTNRALGHQSGSGAQLGSGGNLATTAGSTIVAYGNLITGIGSVRTNSNLAAAVGATTTGTGFNQQITGTNTTFEFIFNRTLTWSSGDAARYFFNCGGYVTWVITGVTNNNGTLRSADLVTQWLTYQASGTITGFGATRSGTGGTPSSGVTNSIGYWQSTTAMQTITQVTSTNYRYEYNSDYTNVRVRTSGVSGSNGDNGAVMTIGFGTYKFSTYAGLNDNVDVTVSHRIDYTVPSTTYLTTSWGVPTIT